MARNFVRASSQYFSLGSAVFTAAPGTMACWFKPASLVNSTLMTIGSVGDTANYFSLQPWSDGFVYAVSTSGLASGFATSGSYGTGSWLHVAGVFTSTASRQVYLSGVAGTADTTAVTPLSLDVSYIGTHHFSAAEFINGDVAEVAFWNVALTANEVATLAEGYSPLLVQPKSLVRYVPFLARATNEEDWVNATVWTNNGVSVAADHPRIIYPRQQTFRPAVAGVVAALVRKPYIVNQAVTRAATY